MQRMLLKILPLILVLSFTQVLCAVVTHSSVANLLALEKNFWIDDIMNAIRLVLRDWSLSLTGSARTCATDILEMSEQPRADIINIIDSIGKPKAGLQRGAVLWLGDYDMCYAVENFDTQYCIARVGPAANQYNFTAVSVQRTLGLGLCVPGRCSGSDLDVVLNMLLEKVPESSKLGMKVYSTQCDFPPPWDAATIIVLILFGFILLLCALAHLIARFLQSHRLHLEASAGSNRLRVNSEDFIVESNRSEAPIVALLTLFDPIKNLKIILSLKPGSQIDSEIEVINGLKFLSMCWIVVNFVVFMSRLFFSNPLDLEEKESQNFLFQIIFGSTFALDTFLVLSGLKLALRIFALVSVRTAKASDFVWPLFYRFIWFMPLYGAYILFFIYIVPHLVAGPFTSVILQEVGNPIDNCRTYWWTNLLFINNYYPAEWSKKCLNWASFIALEVQLLVLSPVLIFLLYKIPIVGWLASLALIAGPIVARTLLSVHFGLPITWDQAQISDRVNQTSYNADVDYTQYAIYTRADSYIIGILCAFVLVKCAKNRPFSRKEWSLTKAISLPLGLILGALAALAVFSTSGQNYAQGMGLVARTVWFAAARPAFALYIVWLVIVCAQFDLGGPIGALLSSKIFRPLARLTHTTFLLYVIVVQFYLANQRDTFYFHDLNIITLSILFLAASFAFGLAWSVMIETPFRRLAKLIMNSTMTPEQMPKFEDLCSNSYVVS